MCQKLTWPSLAATAVICSNFTSTVILRAAFPQINETDGYQSSAKYKFAFGSQNMHFWPSARSVSKCVTMAVTGKTALTLKFNSNFFWRKPLEFLIIIRKDN